LAIVCFVVGINAQLNLPSDCYSIADADTCVTSNNAIPINSSAIHCLWCHSHGRAGKSRSHCAPLQHIKTNSLYHSNWVCDYRMPDVDHYIGGKFNRTHIRHMRNHGRRLLDDDGANQITQFIENEIANWPPAAQIIAGVVYGALGNLPNDLNTCLTDAEQLYTDLENTYNNWQWTFELDVILPELQEVFTDVEEVCDTLKACSGALNDAKDDINKVLNLIAGATGPIGWLVEAGEIAWNSINIYQDVTAAISNFENQRYFDSGYNIGAIVYILI